MQTSALHSQQQQRLLPRAPTSSKAAAAAKPSPPASRAASVAASAASGKREVTLLDYGAGNVRSVRNAIKKLGYSIKDVSVTRAHETATLGASRVCSFCGSCMHTSTKALTQLTRNIPQPQTQ